MNIIEIIGIISGFIAILTFVWILQDRYFPFRKISWKKTQKAALKISTKLVCDDFNPTLILGIGRGGAILGSLISGCLGHSPLFVIDRKYDWSDFGRRDDLIFRTNIPDDYLERILLTAGEAHSGGTMKKYYEYLSNLGAKDIKKAVLFLEEGCPIKIDYYGITSPSKKIRLPWMFTENYLRYDRFPNLQKTKKSNFKLVIMRHAESEAGEEIFAGKTDFRLSTKGLEEALQYAKHLSTKNVKQIFSSNMIRAYETALILKGFLPNVEIKTCDELREMNYGSWDGQKKKDIAQKYKKLFLDWNLNPLDNIPPNSESPSLVQKRILSFMDYIKKTFPTDFDCEVLVVSHKTTIRTLLCYFKGLPLSEYRTIQVDNLQKYEFQLVSNTWSFIK